MSIAPGGERQPVTVAPTAHRLSATVSPFDEGKPYTVRYEAVNAMLLNEFLKKHRKNEEQEKRIDALTAQLKEQAALIQKVSAQFEVSKPVLETIADNQ